MRDDYTRWGRRWQFRYKKMVKATCAICGYVQKWDELHDCPPELEKKKEKK